MKKRILFAFCGASATHAFLLLGLPTDSPSNDSEIDDAIIDLVTQEPPPVVEIEPDPTETDELEASLLPDEFLAPGLAEPPPTSIGREAITQMIRTEPLRPPRPDGIQTIGIPTGAQRRSSGQLAAGIFSLSELDRPPQTRTERMPRYPPTLKTSGTQGSATLLIIVDRHGRVIQAEVEHTTHPEFGRSSYAAVLRWRFEPGLKDGKPVSFRVRLPFDFNL